MLGKAARVIGIVFILSGFGYGITSYEFIETFTIKGDDWNVYEIDHLSPRVSGDQTTYVLSEIEITNNANLELYIDFEKKLKTFTHYRLISTDFQFNTFESARGEQSGKFYTSDHYISLLPKSTSIFYPGEVPGSFTIEFWLYPYKKYDYQYVIRYMGQNLSDENDNLNYGFRVYIKDNVVNYQFENFFWSLDGEPATFEIAEFDELELYKWGHHAVSFNIMNGKLATYNDGIEQDVMWVTENSNFFSPILNPFLHEDMSSPLLIGQDCYFSLDDLIILRTATEDFELNRFQTDPGRLVTDVYEISDNLATLRSMEYEYEASDQSFVKFAYRISENYFHADNDYIEWVYIKSGLEDFPEGYDTGKYIQFKFEIYPYEDITSEISIDSVSFTYVEDQTPNTPILLSAVPGDGKITVKWMPCTESDVVGYEIYYGNKANNYICDDSLGGESPILVEHSQSGTLKAVEYTLLGLNNETPYFISVRSIDENGNRSDYSSELFAIPSTIFNDKGYSISR